MVEMEEERLRMREHVMNEVRFKGTHFTNNCQQTSAVSGMAAEPASSPQDDLCGAYHCFQPIFCT